MRKQSLFVKLCLSAMVFFAPIGVNAQVTIGSNNPPSEFSLLYLDASEQRRALHNARLTTAQRDALVTPASGQTAQNLAMGLMIYNTDTQCLEFWSGSQWVSLCVGETPNPCVDFGSLNLIFCDTDNPTIRSLNDRIRSAGGRGTIRWYDSPSGGRHIDNLDEPLQTGTYWADNCAGVTGRVAVPVVIDLCGGLPQQLPSQQITAWTNVMYDFQNQMLTASHAGATAVQWVARADGATNYTVLPLGNAFSFEILPYFVDDFGDANMLAVYFRAIFTTPAGERASAPFNMLFIRTTTSGFGTGANGVRYLALNRVAAAGGPVRMALLNEGATNDNSLGDLFQWGRQADGHEIINWRKGSQGNPGIVGAGTANIFDPATTHLNRANRPAGTGHLDASGQVTVASGLSNTFLMIGGDWSNGANNLWGDGSTARPATGWTHSGNNPCPAGWRVPSRFELWDVYHGNNNTPGANVGLPTFPAFITTLNSGNSWSWRHPQHGAVGGALIRNSNNEVLFLPAVGLRVSTNGALVLEGIWGCYWSSTFSSETHSWFLYFNNGGVGAGSDVNNRAHGLSVRCVAE